MWPIDILQHQNENLLLPIPWTYSIYKKYGTGASTANVALILIDARKGVIEQTKGMHLLHPYSNTSYNCLYQ